MVPHHLECNLCGARSATVQDRYQLTGREKQLLAEFAAEHVKCAERLAGFRPEDAVTARPDGWVPPSGGPFGSPKADPRSAPRPHGHVHYTGPYGEEQEVDTLSCRHCRRHIEVRSGVIERIGFCALCYDGRPGSGTVCDRPECQAHVPYETRLENAEAGRPLLTPPAAQVSVPQAPPGCGGAVLLVGAGLFAEPGPPEELPDGD